MVAGGAGVFPVPLSTGDGNLTGVTLVPIEGWTTSMLTAHRSPPSPAVRELLVTARAVVAAQLDR